MSQQVFLNDTQIPIKDYKLENEGGQRRLTVIFNVTSKDYHDIAVLLYERTFDIKLPSESLDFKGTIVNYSTSLDNLYEPGQTAEYRVTLQEVA
ncbi:YkvR family protein [Salinicoccus jeotgali]|uniref:YkvR family protein n=1 Tax=Salinicoccus jeotgali TaxID=381634 RepID=A0ABP7F117_9STAP